MEKCTGNKKITARIEKNKKIILAVLILLLCAAAVLSTAGCEKTTAEDGEKNKQSTVSESAVTAADAAVPEKTAATAPQNAAAGSTASKPAAKNSVKAGISASAQSTAQKKAAEKPDDSGGSITICGSGVKETTFSAGEIKKLGTETHAYSFRDKEKNNARQFASYTGIRLDTLLKAVGWDGKSDKIKISCSDGYNGKYSVDEINAFYAFSGAADTKGTPVPAMIAILSEGDSLGKGVVYNSKDGTPFRLVYGQADYDCDDMKDFNTQGWGFYVCKIEVLK